MSRSMSSRSDTSASTKHAQPPSPEIRASVGDPPSRGSCRMSATTTYAPSSAKASDIARPSPELAPVTTIVLPLRRIVGSSCRDGIAPAPQIAGRALPLDLSPLVDRDLAGDDNGPRCAVHLDALVGGVVESVVQSIGSESASHTRVPYHQVAIGSRHDRSLSGIEAENARGLRARRRDQPLLRDEPGVDPEREPDRKPCLHTRNAGLDACEVLTPGKLLGERQVAVVGGVDVDLALGERLPDCAPVAV